MVSFQLWRYRMRYLRKTVNVEFEHDTVNLQHAFWTLQLPRYWVENARGFEQLLRGITSVDNVVLDDPKTVNVVNLLQLAGCLTIPRKDIFTLREVLEIFEPLSMTW